MSLLIILRFLSLICLPRIVGSASIPLKDVINSGEQSHALTGENGAELNVRHCIISVTVSASTSYHGA